MKSINLFVRFVTSLMCVLLLGVTFARAEQYSTGSHTVTSAQGLLMVNVGYVSHFNANDFYIYSFMFRPAGSREWHQVSRVDKEDDPNMLFTIQTKHSAERVLFDARVVTEKNKIKLFTAKLETGETLADGGPITLTTYELVKLEDYERWGFLRQSAKKSESKTSVDNLLKSVTLPLSKK